MMRSLHVARKNPLHKKEEEEREMEVIDNTAFSFAEMMEEEFYDVAEVMMRCIHHQDLSDLPDLEECGNEKKICFKPHPASDCAFFKCSRPNEEEN